jgi:hypothetical protein
MEEKLIKIKNKIKNKNKKYNGSVHNKLFNISSIHYRNDIYELFNGKKSNNFKIQITTSSKFAKNI